MGQYKYYFKKPRGEIVKDILLWLAFGCAIAVAAASSPTFMPNLLRRFAKKKQHNERSVANAFYRLRKEGCINIQRSSHQIYISLTPEGRKKAGRFQINSLRVKKPKRWDKKWRIVVFDIKHKTRVKREALRGFLKRLGFYQLQKSVWVHPYNCEDEIRLLYDFFGFTVNELQLIVAEHIDNANALQKYFRLF